MLYLCIPHLPQKLQLHSSLDWVLTGALVFSLLIIGQDGTNNCSHSFFRSVNIIALGRAVGPVGPGCMRPFRGAGGLIAPGAWLLCISLRLCLPVVSLWLKWVRTQQPIVVPAPAACQPVASRAFVSSENIELWRSAHLCREMVPWLRGL